MKLNAVLTLAKVLVLIYRHLRVSLLHGFLLIQSKILKLRDLEHPLPRSKCSQRQPDQTALLLVHS